MNPILSFTPKPTLLTLPSRARASATLFRTDLPAAFIPSASSELSKVSVLLAVSSCINCELSLTFGRAREVLYVLSAILTSIQWVGLLFKFHKKER